MKKLKSILSAVLAGVMILSTVVGVGAANVVFTDTASHWAKTQIDYLVSKDVINGYKQSDGSYTFNPDGTVTRAEFIKMLDETFGLTATSPINYSDVKTSDWFHPYFSKAAAQGYLLNYGSSVAPNAKLTREEATTLLVRYLDLLDAPKASSSQFTDYNDIASNFRDPVMIAVQAGLINGYEENGGTYTFRPKNTLTRAEALTILYRAAGAVYNTSTYTTKETGAAATNAVITKGGVTISGLPLSGRVIVTEGASEGTVTLTDCTISDTLEIRGASNITLNNCIINKLVVDSISPEITISVNGSTKAAVVHLDSKANMAIANNSTVTNMTVSTAAKNVKVTGTGSIGAIQVLAAGFTSTMVPSEYTIASGLSASFGSKLYEGSSADLASFTSMPYVSVESDSYYLNVLPEADGNVYYYYTNQNYAPSSAEFDGAYTAAAYKDSFRVTGGKIYSEKTFASSLVSKFDNVVIRLVSGNRSYAPIVIDNTPTSGSGFTIDPYFNGEDIEYRTSLAGTIYYYYSDSDDSVTSAAFQTAYNKTDKAMRGSVKASANRDDYLELNSLYLTNYPYVIVVFQNNDGQYYKPVVVSAGDNGFAEEPAITTIGKIEYKTSVTGTLYYYYTDSDKIPTPQEFANTYRVGYSNGSVSVSKNVKGSLSYNTATADRYPYMVFCIKETNGSYLTPFVLRVKYDTGFDVDPYISGTSEVAFRAESTGYVYWYMSKYNTAPTPDTFMSYYNNTSSVRRGRETVRSYTGLSTFTFDSSYTAQYPYIFIMFVDYDENNYQPVMLDVKGSTATGFETAPYCDAASGAVFYRTSGSGTVYYYYSRANVSYNETAEEFWTRYATAGANFKGASSAGSIMDYISYSNIDTSIYPGMVLLYVDEYEQEYYPVYVSLSQATGSGSGSGSSGSTNTSGITVVSVDGSKVVLKTSSSGLLSYYFMGKLTNVNATSSTSQVYANSNIPVEISHTGVYSLLIVQLDGYERHVIDLSKDYEREENPNDGSTKSGYGFISHTLNPNGGAITFTAVSTVDGTATLGLSSQVGLTSSTSVTAGSQFTLSIPFDIDEYLNTSYGQLIGGKIHVQITGDNGDVYERLEISIGG